MNDAADSWEHAQGFEDPRVSASHTHQTDCACRQCSRAARAASRSPAVQQETRGPAPRDRTSQRTIRWAQIALNRILSLRLVADGIAGTLTRGAIRTFQQRVGLPVTGTVDMPTAAALAQASGTALPMQLASDRYPDQRGSSGAPRVLKREALPPGTTLYLEIDQRIVDQAGRPVAAPITGVYLPAGYRPSAQVDLVLYLHGFKQRADRSIDSYWNQRENAHFALREGLLQRRRNLVLVAPTLGPRSQTGRLTRPGGLDQYIQAVLAGIAAHGPFGGRSLALGQLILACHSGGGYPMRQLASGGDQAAHHITECWGFDCTYNRGDDTIWARWARAHPQSRLFIYYIPGSQTAVRAGLLARQHVPNIAILPAATRSHNHVPITHWQERIAAISTRSE